MGATASYLFGGNVTNFLLSMEDKESKKWVVNLDDPAVRSICVAIDGKRLDPYVPPAPPTAAPTAEELKKKEEQEKPRDIKKVAQLLFSMFRILCYNFF